MTIARPPARSTAKNAAVKAIRRRSGLPVVARYSPGASVAGLMASASAIETTMKRARVSA
jgi:hypothetical protein